MKVKYLLTAVAIVVIAQNSFAQYSQDAVLFSTGQTGSTSRIKAIGNAQTAIGGDLSSISGNPAGIGFFTHSEAAFTPEFNSSNVKSTYFGTVNTANTSNLNFNNASAVFYSRLNTPRGSDKTQGWLSLNFGVSYNRKNDFYSDVNYSGKNNNNSITNYYANLANTYGIDNGNSLQDWAYDHVLITSPNGLNPPFSGTGQPGSTQTANNTREGGENEFSLSMGANYSNKLYLGIGIGITSLRYNLNNTFTEAGNAILPASGGGTQNATYTSVYSQNQVTTGDGFNARLGFIYKPADAVRIGATFTTPTYYTVQDDYSEGLRTAYSVGSPQPSGPADYPFTYNFHTPLKVSGGMAVFFGGYGFITADAEYVDYASVKLSSTDGYDATQDNHDIITSYQSTANIHAGGELKLDDVFIRGGYNILGNPQKGFESTKTISGGIGVRFEKFYVDATYTNVKGSQAVYPYVLASNTPQANLDKTYNNAFLTVGFKF
jgi:hypothetical protein